MDITFMKFPYEDILEAFVIFQYCWMLWMNCDHTWVPSNILEPHIVTILVGDYRRGFIGYRM
jgi:hypothetical protein